MTKRQTTHPLRRDRRNRAADRQLERDARTNQEQLDLLIERGHGNCEEALRLRAQI